ncbi:MAG: quinone oxidoreductase [Rickettsiales bacterium]|nr:quinone oxidoreductase [Rickettsiales bacterium]
MVRSIAIEKIGTPEVLSLTEKPLRKPQGSEVLIKHEAIGLNFIDIQYRRGTRPLKTPNVLGCEAAGYIEEVGENATEFNIGDRVAYATAPYGAYSEKRIINQQYLVPLPDYISFTDAAAMLNKGITAHYLLRRTFFVADKNIIMINAASSGVGQLLCQLAQHYGAKVIAIAESEEKYNKLNSLGINTIINSEKNDMLSSVMSHTSKNGVHVVYDSIGKDSFETSIKCLGNFGLMVNFINSSGDIPPIEPKTLREKCLFFTSTDLFTYQKERAELLLTSNEVFSLIKQKAIKSNIYKQYLFSEIKEAHSDLENHKVIGQCILIP